MTTATDEYTKTQQRLQCDAWGQRCENFVRKFAPSDPYDRREFEQLFYSLIRQTWIEAQEPVLSRLTDIAIRTPLSMVTLK